MSGRKPNGAAVSAFLAAMIGLLVMGIINTAASASSDFNSWVHSVGKLWIPNAQGIGPYSGKETFLLLAWVLSWAVLHMLLRKREVKLAVPAAIFAVGVAVATLLVYTPFVHFVLAK